MFINIFLSILIILFSLFLYYKDIIIISLKIYFLILSNNLKYILYSKIKPNNKVKKQIKKTTVIFNLINYNINKRNDDYYYKQIKFESLNKIINVENLIDSKKLKIEFEIEDEEENYIYIERIQLINGEKYSEFLVSIYIEKENNFYIDINIHDNNYYAFEIIYYGKNNNLPDFIRYTNRIKLDIFDTYDLKFRKRLTIINAKEKSINFNINNLKSGSYKICNRINNLNNNKISIHQILKKEYEKISFKNDRKKDYLWFTFKCICLFKKFKDVNKDYNYEKLINEFNYLKSLSKKLFHDKNLINKYTKSFLIQIEEINYLDLYYLYAYYFYLILTDNTFNDLNCFKFHSFFDFNTNFELLYDCYSLFEKIKTGIEKSNIEDNYNNKDLESFRLFRNLIYNILSIQNITDLTFVEIIDTYSQKIKIIDIEKLYNCFNYSIYFLKKIANSLKEESALIDIFLQYNSGISINYNNIYNKTSFELTMLDINQIKNHLIKLLPKKMIIYNYDDNRFGSYDTYNDVTMINISTIFIKNKDIDKNINNLYNYKYYSIPIIYLLMHEVWSHAKISLIDKKSETPKKNNILSKNFREIEIISPYNINKGESGYLTEYVITGFKPKDNNNNIENYLLNVCEDKEFLLDINLWNKNNFDDLRTLIKQHLKNTKIDLFKGLDEKFSNKFYFKQNKVYNIKKALEEFPYFKP